MAIYFLDSSAVVKLYQPEAGSEEVDRIVSEPGSTRLMSRLALVEVQRALCRRLRVQDISESELDDLRRGFYEDLLQRRIRVKQLQDRHYRSAVRLIRKYAPEFTLPLPLLRTLDALHLVSALEVQALEGLDYFVSADANLCKIAQEEQLSVINPAP
jgi:predicted nucleic acid-binding protein